jgi:hypothetical protein
MYIRSHSVVIGANVPPCYVMGSENVSFITKGFLSLEREWNLASALFLGIYIYVRSFTSRVLDVPSIVVLRSKSPLVMGTKNVSFYYDGFSA